jgi:hypothetical protein
MNVPIPCCDSISLSARRMAIAWRSGAAVPGEFVGQQQAQPAGRAGDHRYFAADVVLHGQDCFPAVGSGNRNRRTED